MRKIIACVFLGFLCFCAALSVALPSSGSQVKVASKGETDVRGVLGAARVVVKIGAHEEDIGRPSDRRPDKLVSSCTYSRYPCSPIDSLGISVNGKMLFVARSVYADMADVNVATLTQEKGYFILILEGGDASESYTVKIIFDNGRIKKRILMVNEAKRVMQETTYFAPEAME